MPELPEVEIIKRQLDEYLVGYSVEEVVREEQVVRGELRDLVGASVTQIRRRGKGIIIDFDNDLSLAIHLKMTGQIIFREAEWQSGKDLVQEKKYRLSKKVGTLPGAHTHVILKMINNEAGGHEAYLYYNDIRKFGWLHVLPTKDVPEHKFFRMLGLEPFLNLDLEGFTEILQGARTPIKTLLMDQSKIAGIGNIYANEALWMSKIHPRRAANSLGVGEVELLYSSLLEVMERSLALGASSENTYVNALGQEGDFQNHFQVYHREGVACSRCGTLITRFDLGGRGTFVCSKCQVLS